MTFLKKFNQTFKDDWLILKDPKLKNIRYIKILPDNDRRYDMGANYPIILVNHKFIFNQAQRTISYYKLFCNCTIVEDEETLAKLKNVEVKYLLTK